MNGEAITVVKFAKIDSKTNITESDKAMFNLNQMEKILTEKCEKMESQISQMDEKIRALIREKNRDMAKNYLKRKKIVIVDLGEMKCLTFLILSIDSHVNLWASLDFSFPGLKLYIEILKQF